MNSAGIGAGWRQRLEQAVQLHQAGRLDEAIGCYRDVLVENKDCVDALHLLGVALEQAGHPAQGKPLVELAVRREPGIAAYRNSLGNICKALDDEAGAQAAYAEALRLDPRSAEILNNLGLLAQRRQDWATALGYFDRAVAADKTYVAATFNRAVTQWLAGDTAQALPVFSDLLPRMPDYAVQLVELAKRSIGARDAEGLRQLIAILEPAPLGTADRSLLQGGLAALDGDRERAEVLYREGLAASPGHLDLLRCYSLLLIERESHAEAIPFLERALASKPDDASVIAALGISLTKVKAWERAIPLLQQLVERNPEAIGGWVDLAQCYSHLNRLDEACEAMARVIALDPDKADNYATLAGFEGRRGDIRRGEELCLEALRRDPENGAAIGNLGNIRALQGRVDEAEALFRKQLALRPEDAGTHCNLSFLLLRCRRYKEGWSHYHWRWKQPSRTTPEGRERGLPRWDGVTPPDGRLLIWREQGVGDEILYSSLIADFAARGLDIVLAADPRLVPLLARSLPGITVVPDDASLDVRALGLSCQRPLGDIGEFCRPDIASFASHPAHYLKADPARSAALRQRYRAMAGDRPLVGVSWNSGNPNTGRYKSISLSDMAPLLRRPGEFFVSLQYGRAAEDVKTLPADMPVHHDPEIDPLADIDGQAAQIAALDLVVTVSTAAAHIAGGLGIPTLILIPEDWGQLWYWGYTGERTPWYPSVRLCRGDTGQRAGDIVERALPMVEEMLADLRKR